jgi:type 2 lantibiotic biosynthesis protein LanM
MHVALKQLKVSVEKNRPQLVGRTVDVTNHTEAIVTGFSKMYQLLLENRDELLAIEGPVSCFKTDETRVIFRPSQTYATLLSWSFHPDVLRNALDRDRLFDSLWASAQEDPSLIKIIEAERLDLQTGNIPIFTARPGSHDLRTSAGEVIPKFFSVSSMSAVQQRFEMLGANDLERQIWFITASLAYGHSRAETVGTRNETLVTQCDPPHSLELMDGALEVGDRIQRLAFQGDDDACWIGMSSIKEGRPSPALLQIDLYDGLTGVALFLAHLGALNGEVRHTTLARAAVQSIRRQARLQRSSMTLIGGYTGWGGLLYVLTQLSHLWDDSSLLDEAEELVPHISSLIAQDQRLDVLGGAAGAIVSLLGLHRGSKSPGALATAIQCGDHLIARSNLLDPGVDWGAPGKFTGLSGFSHGAAGIAWALFELATASHEERFHNAGLKAILYERTLFREEPGNWADLRGGQTDAAPEESFMTAWCHGAPGIGLARLASLQYLDDAEVRKEIDTALKTTVREGFGTSHSLCHGDLGNVEVLLYASQVLNSRNWRECAYQFAGRTLSDIRRDGWLCGGPMGVEVPGLMTGLSGIGYQMLRLAYPDRVPSVLTLESCYTGSL